MSFQRKNAYFYVFFMYKPLRAFFRSRIYKLMKDTNLMSYQEFREIFESLDLKRKDAVQITGKTVNTFDKWSQEDIVKDPAAVALFRMALILQDNPYHFTKKDAVDLLFKSSGAINPYDTELNEAELRTQAVKRLKSIMSQLED